MYKSLLTIVNYLPSLDNNEAIYFILIRIKTMVFKYQDTATRLENELLLNDK